MRVFAATLALAVGLAASGPAHAASKPRVGAPEAIVVDAQTGEMLWGRNPDGRHAIASTTKLMTAYVTLKRTRPDEVFTAPPYSPGPGESLLGLHTGERMTVHDLLLALMLPSANDAAHDLAVNEAGSIKRFVRWMNQEARALGLRETHYSTPVGLDDPGNYSTPRDLAKLATIDLRNPTFAKIVRLPRAHLTSGSHPRTVVNRNDLVGRYPFVNGVKTGHTNAAGYALVGSAVRGGAHVISVELGDPSESTRDADSLALLRFGLGQFRVATPIVAGRTYARAHVKWFGSDRKVRLVAAHSLTVTVRRGRRLRVRANAPSELEGPLPAGRRVGTLDVIYGGRVLRTVPLVTGTPVPAAGVLRKAVSALGGPLPAIALLALVGAAAFVAIRARRRGSKRENIGDDHHRHAERRDRQDARRAELPARAAASGGRADVDGGGQGRQRR